MNAKIQQYVTNIYITLFIAVRGHQKSPWAHRAGGLSRVMAWKSNHTQWLWGSVDSEVGIHMDTLITYNFFFMWTIHLENFVLQQLCVSCAMY